MTRLKLESRTIMLPRRGSGLDSGGEDSSLYFVLRTYLHSMLFHRPQAINKSSKPTPGDRRCRSGGWDMPAD